MSEFLEALGLHTYIEIEEFHEMLELEPGEKMGFRRAVDVLAATLIDKKRIPFASLVNQHFSIPADRITKFLKLLKTDL